MSSEKPMDFPERGDRQSVEQGLGFQPRFDADGLIPCICQERSTGRILMFAYMNREALGLTIRTGEAHYYSRSRGRLWRKGESSGHTQKVLALLTDCDQDVILIQVDTGGAAACHTGYHSCFFREAAVPSERVPALRLIEDGRQFDPDQVYGAGGAGPAAG